MLRTRLAAVFTLSLACLGLTGTSAPPATAAAGQLPVGQVVLNPLGGQSWDGADGLRMVVNDPNGSDMVDFGGQPQYCCGGVGPMLNVGGTLFGSAGAAYHPSVATWSSLTVLATSGSTVPGAATAGAGSGTATLRYVATKGALTYTVDRTLSYVFPDDFVTETYAFTIPVGNTEQVRFYLGGDTHPGGDDEGIGEMLTAPVRTVSSINLTTGHQIGFREVAGSKPFDGATARRYDLDWPTVRAGGDIGFTATPAVEDSGVMVQWDLGSTPGVQSHQLTTVTGFAGLNLTGGLTAAVVDPGTVVPLTLTLTNRLTTGQSDVDFTLNLPAGLRAGPGFPSSTCSVHTMDIPPDRLSIRAHQVAVGAQASCVVSYQLVASTTGTHSISAASITGASSGLTVAMGSSSFQAAIAPRFTTTTLGALGVADAASVTLATGADPAAAYAVTGGQLPAGLTLNATTGVLSGTPTTAGTYSFTVTATNVRGTDSQTFTGTVAKGHTSMATTITTPISFGGTATLTVSGLPPAATGQVTFTSAGTTWCTATLPTTRCTGPSSLEPGNHTVLASYSGDANWEATSAPATLAVDRAPSSLTGSLSGTRTTVGEPVTVTATVTPTAATGTVTATTGGTTLCTITLPATTCQTPQSLGTGTHPVTLTYSGDARHSASSATAGTFQVTGAPDRLPLTGTSVLFTAPLGLVLLATGGFTLWYRRQLRSPC